MSTWALTDGLMNLRNQMNERFPQRDRRSDGTIGDTAHQAETSGHNPDDTAGSRPAWNGDSDSNPEVRAWDMDSDLGETGMTAQMVVDHIRSLPGVADVLRCMIYDRTMYHARDEFVGIPYDGASAHTEHIHLEGAWTNAADKNRAFDFRLGEIGDIVDQSTFTKFLLGALKDIEVRQAVTRATLGTDGVIASPASAESKNADGTPNEYWAGGSFLQNIYDIVNAIRAKQS